MYDELLLDFVLSKLSDWFGSPCDYNFIDAVAEDLLASCGWCEENCETADRKDCWRKLFELIHHQSN